VAGDQLTQRLQEQSKNLHKNKFFSYRYMVKFLKSIFLYASLKETPILLCKVNDFYPDLHNSTTGTWYMYRQIEKKTGCKYLRDS
jgi:hypothetical protein